MALIILCLLCISYAGIAQPPPASDYYSRADGTLQTNGTWSTDSHDGSSCSCNPGCSVAGNKTLRILHSITTSCDPLEIYGNVDFIMEEGGDIVINGDLNVYGNADYIINENSTVTVNGDLNVYGNAEIELSGSLTVNGDVDVSGSGSVCGDGNAEVSGTITGSGWCYSITVLPIELLSFKATLTDDQGVLLSWETATEVDNDYFVIERSSNGMIYHEIANKEGAGTSSSIREYSFRDQPLNAGTYYYRLTQVDFDGKSTSFEVVAVTIKDDSESNLCTLEVHPNPCVPWCEARLVDCPDGPFRANIMDASGHVISELIPSSQGHNGVRYHINQDNYLMPGIYIIQAHHRNAKLTKKIIVK